MNGGGRRVPSRNRASPRFSEQSREALLVKAARRALSQGLGPRLGLGTTPESHQARDGQELAIERQHAIRKFAGMLREQSEAARGLPSKLRARSFEEPRLAHEQLLGRRGGRRRRG